MELLEKVKTLSLLCGASGAEDAVRRHIISMLPAHAQHHTDALVNLIVFVKGKETPKRKLMLAAHMDEVGFMVSYVCDNGLLKFTCVGGISPSVLCGKRVVFENGTVGVFGVKPIHMLEGDKRREFPAVDDMYIDVGAASYDEAVKLVKPGDTAVFLSDFVAFGDQIKGKALDDRAGSAVLLEMLDEEQPYDFYLAFTVQEEVGCRGAGAAVHEIAPDYAIVVETTTAADLPNVSDDKKVCALGEGPAISFMDRGTVYDPALYRLAMDTAAQHGIKAQPKRYVAGGNDASVIHKSLNGVKTLTVSMPCRYLHSPACVLHTNDIQACADFVKKMTEVLCNA